MQSIFRYPGGKTKKNIREKILSKAPTTYKEYREPFVGGGGIFFSISPDIKRWINDIDPNLINVYQSLRDRANEFISMCYKIEPEKNEEAKTAARPGGKKLYNARLKEWFDFFAENTTCDQALRYFFVNRTNWAGRVNYDIKSRMYFSCPEGWNIVKTNKLQQAANLLQSVKITNGEYKTLLETEGDDCWIYCDPPYVRNTQLSTHSQLYKYGFDRVQHKIFADIVRTCKHKVCISYDDDDDGYIRELFPETEFTIFNETWTYCGTSSASDNNQPKKKRKGKELIITNYKK